MIPTHSSELFGWERSMAAADKVRERLVRAVTALEAAGIPYAVVGGHAVAEWVGRVDEDAVRNTKDVDILLETQHLEAAKQALSAAGFVYYQVSGVDLFIDGEQGKPSAGIHILYAGVKVREDYESAAPGLSQSERGPGFQVISLQALVEMKLNSFRRKDQMHIVDLISVGLIDASWPAKFSPTLASRLQSLLDDPNG